MDLLRTASPVYVLLCKICSEMTHLSCYTSSTDDMPTNTITETSKVLMILTIPLG